ncbi:MAG: hypothetical protein IIA10_02295 [Proteobacteria bacterium]|nr:hypothetical protein [Pseudomonadota bacterium]
MASLGAEPNLGAVSGDPQAFVSGLNRAFMVAGSLVVVAMVISFLKGERAKEAPDHAIQSQIRVTPGR